MTSTRCSLHSPPCLLKDYLTMMYFPRYCHNINISLFWPLTSFLDVIITYLFCPLTTASAWCLSVVVIIQSPLSSQRRPHVGVFSITDYLTLPSPCCSHHPSLVLSDYFTIMSSPTSSVLSETASHWCHHPRFLSSQRLLHIHVITHVLSSQRLLHNDVITHVFLWSWFGLRGPRDPKSNN